MDEVNGVFLLSKNLSTEFMIKCMQMLLRDFPDVKVTSVVSDELHFGYRVCFSSPEKDIMLMRKLLLVSGEEVPIGPLKTFLTIHGVRKNGGERYEKEIKETICNKFGKLLHIDHVSSFEHEITRNLRACVDAPELEELVIFNHEGHPGMFICLPSNNEMLKVTFYCRRCEKDGHTQHDCLNLKLLKEEVKTEYPYGYAKNIGSEDASKKEILPVGNLNDKDVEQGPSSVFMKVRSQVNLIPRNLSLLRNGIEVWEHVNYPIEKSSKNLNDAKCLINNDDKDFKFNIDDEVQEIDYRDFSNSSIRHPSFTIKTENKDNGTSSRKDSTSNSETFSISAGIAGPSSTSALKPTTAVEEKISIPEGQSSSDNAQNGMSSGSDLSSTANSETFSFSYPGIGGPSSASLVKPTTAVEENNILIPELLASTDNVHEDTNSNEEFRYFQELLSSSSQNMVSPKYSASKQLKILSPLLQTCIDNACAKFTVLNRDELEAFFIHVKSKSNPAEIARNYTSNVWELKKLLQEIITLFYKTRQDETKEDKYFIKWLQGLVQRLEECIPTKRKLFDNFYESPNKK